MTITLTSPTAPVTVEYLREALAQVQQELSEARTQYEDLMQRAATATLEYAERYGWCDEARLALEDDLGIEWPGPTAFEFEITVRATFRGSTNARNGALVDFGFIRDSIREVNVADLIEMDGDWEDVSLEYHDIDVSDWSALNG